jgi:hypothetical protein
VSNIHESFMLDIYLACPDFVNLGVEPSEVRLPRTSRWSLALSEADRLNVPNHD